MNYLMIHLINYLIYYLIGARFSEGKPPFYHLREEARRLPR